MLSLVSVRKGWCSLKIFKIKNSKKSKIKNSSQVSSRDLTPLLNEESVIACVASVSEGLSVDFKHFSLFGHAKERKCLERAEKPTDTLASQATIVVILFGIPRRLTVTAHKGVLLMGRFPKAVH